MKRLLFIVLIITSSLFTSAQSSALYTRPIDPPCWVKPNHDSFIIITSKIELKEGGCYFNFFFDEKSIIGISGSIGGCSVDFSLEIFENVIEKKYEIRETIIRYGACRKNNHYCIIHECKKLDPTCKIEMRPQTEIFIPRHPGHI